MRSAFCGLLDLGITQKEHKKRRNSQNFTMADYSTCWTRLEGTPAAEIDLGIAMEHLVLAAAAEGLGTCWICAFEKAKMNEVMQVSQPWCVEAITPLGYANKEPRTLSYKSIDQIFKVVK